MIGCCLEDNFEYPFTDFESRSVYVADEIFVVIVVNICFAT